MKPRNVISAALFLALPLGALADDVIVNVNPDPYNLPPQAVSPAYPQPAPTPTEIDPAKTRTNGVCPSEARVSAPVTCRGAATRN